MGMSKDVSVPDLPQDGRGVPFRSLLTPMESMGALRDFVTPAKDRRAMLMRTVFEDEGKAKACAIILFKGGIFNYPQEFYDLILDTQAAMCSVKGRSTLMLLMGVCQIIAPELLKTFGKMGKKMGKGFRMKGTEESE